jgi:2-dehydropantoate 2-reductase
MNIAIMGSGALGSYIGGRLAHSGQDVTFIARGAQLTALRQKGLTVTSHFGDFSLETVTATDNCAEVGPVDLILFCVKSYSAQGAAEQMKPMVGPETVIIPVLNGVDHIETLQETVGQEHVLGGVCIFSAHLVEPGHVEQAGSFHALPFGELNGDLSARCMMIQPVLAETGIEAMAVPDIVERMWWKMTAMCGLFGVYSVVRANNAVISAVPETRNLVLQAIGEAVAVAQAKQIPVSSSVIDEIDAAINNMPPAYQPSMKVDLEQGNRLELEAVNGFISRTGKALGVPTPLNDFIYACLKPYVKGRPEQ